MEDGGNLQYPITTGTQPLIGPWPVFKKDRFHRSCRRKQTSVLKRRLHSERGSHGTCSNLVFYLRGEINFDLFWSHTGWFIVGISCKSIKSTGSSAKKRIGVDFRSMLGFSQYIYRARQLHAGIKECLFSNISSGFRCVLRSQIAFDTHFENSQRHFQRLTLGDIQKLRLGDNRSLVQLFQT